MLIIRNVSREPISRFLKDHGRLKNEVMAAENSALFSITGISDILLNKKEKLF